MQEIVREIRQKHQREFLFKKVANIKQKSHKKIAFQDGDPLPYPIPSTQMLYHNHEHIAYPKLTEFGSISNRIIYLNDSYGMYTPMRINQIRQQRDKSDKLAHGNSFLSHYDETNFIKAYNFNAKDKQERLKSEEHSKRSQQKPRSLKEIEYIKLPKINMKHKHKRKVHIWRSISIAIFFIKFLQKRSKNNLVEKQQRSQKLQNTLVKEMQIQIKQIYFNLLETELVWYLTLLENKDSLSDEESNQQIMRMLCYFTKKLSSSSLSRAVHQNLCYICDNNSFIPINLLFYVEANRLQFSDQFGCIVNVKLPQAMMIVACLIGIKYVCLNLLYRPWIAADLLKKKDIKFQTDFKKQYYNYKPKIDNIGSIIYFTIMKNYVYNLQKINRTSFQLNIIQKQFDFHFQRAIQITLSQNQKINKKQYQTQKRKESQKQNKAKKIEKQSGQSRGENENSSKKTQRRLKEESKDQNKSKNSKDLSQFLLESDEEVEDEQKEAIFLDQDISFYQQMLQKSGQSMLTIKANIEIWVKRITLSCLKENKLARINRARQLFQKKMRL